MRWFHAMFCHAGPCSLVLFFFFAGCWILSDSDLQIQISKNELHLKLKLHHLWRIALSLTQDCSLSKTMVSVLHAKSSVAGLALFLVAFTRATLIVLCRGENGKLFCLAELWPCTNMRFFPTTPTLPTFLLHPSPLFYSRHFSPGPLSWSETARKRLLTSFFF